MVVGGGEWVRPFFKNLARGGELTACKTAGYNQNLVSKLNDLTGRKRSDKISRTLL